MNYKNNLELSIYLRSFGIFDTNIISAIEEMPIEFFKTENIKKNVSLKQKLKNKFDKLFISFVANEINDNLIKKINFNGKFISPKLISSEVKILQLFKVD